MRGSSCGTETRTLIVAHSPLCPPNGGGRSRACPAAPDAKTPNRLWSLMPFPFQILFAAEENSSPEPTPFLVVRDRAPPTKTYAKRSTPAASSYSTPAPDDFDAAVGAALVCCILGPFVRSALCNVITVRHFRVRRVCLRGHRPGMLRLLHRVIFSALYHFTKAKRF